MSLDILAAHGCAVKQGTTHGTADTVLATLPVNPFNSTRVMCIAIGKGVYIEDDGSVSNRPSGITATTVDVRSTSTSAKFTLYIFPLGSAEVFNG